MFSRQKVAPLVAEAMGAAVLTISLLAINRSAVGLAYFVAIGAGLAYALVVLALGNVSGALANPALTLAMWVNRKVDTMSAILYIVAQFVGAMGALQLYTYLTNRSVTSMAEANFDWRVLVAEAVGAFVFTFAVSAAVSQRFVGGKLAAAIGMAYGVGILIAGVAANGILNPAVAVGMNSWNRAYALGPVVGALVGVVLQTTLFAGESLLPARKAAAKQVTKKAPARRKR